MHPYVAVPANIALIWRAYSRKSLTPLGLAVAALTGVVHSLHPWSVFFALLVVFFLGGTAVTKVKHDVKARLTLSSSGLSGGEGPRTHVQVLANSVVASVLILLHYRQLLSRHLSDKGGNASRGCWPYGGDLLVVGIISNYAAVAADTFSSELGILSKSKPRLITSWNLRQVPPGTNGGVTLLGLMAGILGALTIALTSTILLPFCPVEVPPNSGKLFGEHRPGLEGGSGWGWREKALFTLVITFWGGLGSILDSFLGGWLQASVIDARTGKVIEGTGGKKVPINGDPLAKSKQDGQASRQIESGFEVLDNNAVNIAMALLMSIGGMLIASYIWEIPFSTLII